MTTGAISAKVIAMVSASRFLARRMVPPGMAARF